MDGSPCKELVDFLYGLAQGLAEGMAESMGEPSPGDVLTAQDREEALRECMALHRTFRLV